VSSSGDGDEPADTSDAGNTDETSDPADAGEAAETDHAGDCPDWQENPEPDLPSLGPEVPSVDVPEVEVPGTDSETVGADVDVDTAKGFWRLVLIFDVALLALALGPMFVYFMDDWRRGGMLLGFGLLAFLYGVARYREFQTAAENTGDDDAGNDGDVGDVGDEV